MRPPEREAPAAVGPRAPGNATTNEPHQSKPPAADPQPDVNPELLPWRRVRAASDAEIDEVIAAHNAAVRAWNDAERDPSQPLPRILDHGRWRFSLGFTRGTRGVHACRLPDGLSVFLKTKGWHPFPGGWSCARRVLARVDVVRAEIRVPRLDMEGRAHG